jgi:hypothetical protein
MYEASFAGLGLVDECFSDTAAQTMAAQARMAGAMQSASAVMTKMSAAVPLSDIRKTTEQFQREQMKSEMAEACYGHQLSMGEPDNVSHHLSGADG